ncbi:hypothetical protein SASPL_124705 [Salvia splendens]|uniref:Uncharacterized protein n=1 Tax=Salvia splendens TaxID=180675 RepID=A0A8X8XGA1_SALSN|nr:uncharacterized protein LOC121747309 [Salvia splendens]KAG6412044.1 hypothetical protein SASPL_124705 [Salvia splendens]
MENGGCQEIDLELEADDLIGDFQLPETVDAIKVGDSVGFDVNDRLPELHESSEPERKQRNGRYNMRKSLAWDSAFFTSAGVLDAEELSSMITKPDKKEKHLLPGIQEDLTGSTESISTLQSDCLTLESNEDDLFMDIRASIQRSSKKASNFTNSSRKLPSMVLDGTALSSPKKEDCVSPQNKCPKPCVKKTSGLQTVRMSKPQLKPIGKLAPGRPIKPNPAQSQAGSTGKSGEMNSVVPKRLKTISSFVPSSTAATRESVGTSRLKPEFGNSRQGSVPGKVTQPPKVSALGGTRKVQPKPAVSSKCSSVGSSTTSNVPSTRSSTSSDSSINTSSGKATKPTLMVARRNLGKSTTSGPGPSGSIPNTPSRALPKNKLPASNLSAYLKSTKISSSVSPASSISDWSSVSSTTSSVVNLRSSNSRSSIDTSSCRSGDGDNLRSDPRHMVAGRKAERQGIQGAISTCNTSKKSTTTSGTLQAPVIPSGLRLPSTKFGYFDGSSSRTPDGNQPSQSTLHPVIPKNGAAASTPTRSSNGKLKSVKVPTARMPTSLANLKSPKAASPAPSHEKSHALVKASSVSMDVTNSSSLSAGVKTSVIGETYQEAVEVQAYIEVVTDAGADDTDNLGKLRLTKNMTIEDITTATADDNNALASESISQIGDGLVMLDELKMNSVSTYEAVKKDEDPAKYPDEGVTGDETGICEKIEPYGQLLTDTSECALSSTTDASEAAACRSPISVNFFCDSPTKLVIPVAVAEDTSVVFPSSGSECIEQIDSDLIKDKPEKNLIPASGAKEKETTKCEREIGLTEGNKGIHQEPNCQLVSDTSECALYSTAAASEAAACRSPTSLNNLSCGSECVDNPTELVIPVAVAENISVALPSSGSEYFVQIDDGLIEDEPKKNLIPNSGATKKDNDPTKCQGERGLAEENNSDTSECALYSIAASSEAVVHRSPFALKNFSSSKESVLSSTETASEAASCRSPTSLKNFSYRSECVDNSTELVIPVGVAENISVAFPSSGSEDIVQTDYGLIMDEPEKNLTPTSGATEKENNPTKCEGEGGLTEENKGVHQNDQEPNCQLVSDSSECALYSTAAAPEAAVNRTPLSSTAAASEAAGCSSPISLKNVSCGSECVDTPTELAIQVAVAENISITLPSSGSGYIVQIDDGLVKDEPKKNLIPTSGATEKENDPPTKCEGEGGSTEENKGVYQKYQEPNCQLVSDTSECALYSTAAASEAVVHRTPFALKNFSCSNECVDKSTEVAIQVTVAENALPSSEEKENS